MNTDKNTALYEKMAAEQDKFRDWLKSQPPEEILKHTYEYTVREDILMAMEELDLPQSRAAALLASPSPLADVYKEFADRETSYMDVVRDSIEQRADAALDDGSVLPVLNVGPLCIAPEMQRQGLGRLLLDTALQKAAERGFGAAVLEGDPAFYGPSGFVPGKTVGIRYADDPEADYFLVKELRPGFLQGKHGIYRDPAGYFVCLTRPQEFADFEAQFPAK